MIRRNSVFSIVRCDGAKMGWSFCRRDGTEQVETSATGNGAALCQSDEFKPLDEEEKRLYQRIVAKLNYPGHDRLDLKYATSCLASAVSSPSLGDMQAVKQGGRYLRKAPVAWQGFPFTTHGADWASIKTSRRSMSGGVVTLGGGILNCLAKKQKNVALSSWESELFAVITSGTRSLEIQSELMGTHNAFLEDAHPKSLLLEIDTCCIDQHA